MIKVSKSINMPIVYQTAAEASELVKSSAAAITVMLDTIGYKAS